MYNIKSNSFVNLVRTFPNETACIKHLESLYWDRGKPVSPFDATSKVYKCKDGRYKCRNTGKYFKVTTGTMFQDTKIKLHIWFWAIWFVTVNKAGISSYQLARHLGITQKTAWFMLHKIREQMKFTNNSLLTGEVEMDEALIGGLNKYRHWDKKVEHSQGRSHKDKIPVVGMMQRGGVMVARVTKDATAVTLSALIKQFIDPTATIYTDDNIAYNPIAKTYNRLFIDHGKHQYANGTVTTNRIEASWTHLKRGLTGTHRNTFRKTAWKYLQKYVDEFVFRYNLRGTGDYDRFNCLLCHADKRITYEQIKQTRCVA